MPKKQVLKQDWTKNTIRIHDFVDPEVILTIQGSNQYSLELDKKKILEVPQIKVDERNKKFIKS
jgi:hypothetical protein